MMLPYDRAFTVLLLLALYPSIQAQSTKAELFGVVRDPAGLPAEGATVELINTATDAKLSAQSGADGGYHFFGLVAGSYQIILVKAGFATLHRYGVIVRVGDRIGIDLELRVGDVSQSVEVTAAAPLLQSSRG